MVHRIAGNPDPGDLRHPDTRHPLAQPAASHSRALAVGTALLGMVLPLSPLGPLFGFVAPPPVFYSFVVAAVLVYLCWWRSVKRAFYRFMARHPA